MENSFLDIQYIVSYGGILILVWLLTQLTKNLFDKLGENKTKWIVLIYSVILVSAAKMYAVTMGEPFVWYIIIEWLINVAVVWTAVMKSHELIIENN
jgi:hypothetical protein